MNRARTRFGMTHSIDHRPFRFGLGDALDEARSAARDRVNSIGGDYVLPNVPTSREQALFAYILLMRSARNEVPKFTQQAKTLIDDAPWFYRAATIETVLRNAVNVLSVAPRTRAVALEVLNSTLAAQKAAVKKAKDPASVAYPPKSAPTPVAPPAPSLLDQFRPYAGPIIGGAAALVGLAVFFWPRSKP